jgi:hypothetical protein
MRKLHNTGLGIICSLLLTQTLRAAPFTDLGDGTVRDGLTKLYWQKCSNGQGTPGAQYTDCASGVAVNLTWQAALAYCNGLPLAGRVWRVPNVSELRSIVDDNQLSPSIDSTVFPNTVSGAYVSSTTKHSAPNTQRGVWFIGGHTGQLLKTTATSVRCVSGP